MSSLLAPALLSLLVTGQGIGMDPREPQTAVVGKVDHRGYVLYGPRGRHYIFGGLAVADYTDSAGKRLIVTLQEQEDSGALPDADQFLYFREIGTGNRWSISRRAAANGKYSVHFQPYQETQIGAVRPTWQAFQQADYAEDHILGGGRGGRMIPEGGNAGNDLQFRSPSAPFSNPPRIATAPPIMQDWQEQPGIRYAPSQPSTPVYYEQSGCCGR